MNTIECTITEILSEPVHEKEEGHEWWVVKVRINCYGRKTIVKEVCNSLKEAKKIKVGDKVWR